MIWLGGLTFIILDAGYDCDFYATLPDPNVVATLLKMYLRERK
jgi:hypothetical protein